MMTLAATNFLKGNSDLFERSFQHQMLLVLAWDVALALLCITQPSQQYITHVHSRTEVKLFITKLQQHSKNPELCSWIIVGTFGKFNTKETTHMYWVFHHHHSREVVI